VSTDRDPTRIVRSWLRTDEHESADHILERVLLLVDATPQRRSLWAARRIATVNTVVKVALATAAVVVVAIVGINLLPASGGVGGAPASSPSSSVASPSGPSARLADAFPPAGELAIGRVSMIRNGVPFSIDVPAGWRSQQGFELIKGVEGEPDGAGFIFWSPTPDNVYADPCAHQPLSPAAGPGSASLANAVSRIPGAELVSGPTDVTVGGKSGKRTVITIPTNIDCAAAPGGFLLWYRESPPGGARFPTALPSTMSVWIIDVDGTVVWIDGETFEGASPTLTQEMQQMIDSIRFE
jgi:hypothetical protein